MTHVSIYWITILFVFVIVLLCASTIYSRIHWSIKAILIILSFSMFITFYLGYINSLGWPIKTQLPEKFRLIASDILPPIPDMNDKGAIYLWVLDQNSTEPRSIELPYSKELHKKLEEAKKKGEQGEEVYMETGPKDEQKKKGWMRPWSFYDFDITVPDFIPPPSTLPEK